MIIIAIVSALVGMLISYRIYVHKQSGRPLMCPREMPCDTVLNSRYAETLGVGNEVWGIAYYSVATVLTAIISVTDSSLGKAILPLLSGFGMLAYLYLVWVQAVKLRAWCLWCLASLGANAILFIIAVLLYRI